MREWWLPPVWTRRFASPARAGRVSIDGETHVPADRLHSLLLLAREALEAGDGEIPDERVRQAGLTSSPD